MKKFKKILSIILSLLLVITSIITVLPVSYAESNTDSTTLDNEFEVDEEYDYSYDDLRDLIPGEDYAEGEIIIKYSPQNQSSSIENFANEYNLTIEDNLNESTSLFNTSSVVEASSDEGIYFFSFDEDTSVPDLIQKVSVLDEVEYAQPNYIYKTCEIEESIYELYNTETEQATQYQQAMLKSMNIGSTNYTGKNVVVAVIDSGMDFSHPALINSMWSQGDIAGFKISSTGARTEISSTQTGIYTSDHGTHVAGIIAMKATEEYSCRGIAPDVRIMNIQTALYTNGIIKAISTAVEYGADVVNMSFGGYNYDHLLNVACNKAARKLVLVASAGNEFYERHINYPASFSSVIGVMAYGGSPSVDDYPEEIKNSINNDTLSLLNVNYPDYGNMTTAIFTNTDSTLRYYEIIAPGVNICSAKARTENEKKSQNFSNYKYTLMSGTSMATPVVSGTVALYIEKHPNASPGQIRDAFRTDSQKSVEKFDSFIKGVPTAQKQFISNQIDVSKILAYTPNSQTDDLFEHNNNPDYEPFCNFVKSQFGDDFSSTDAITNEDIRLISFVKFTSISDIENVVSYLPLLHNLIGIEFNGYSINDSAINSVLNACNLNELEVLIFNYTQTENLIIPFNACPKLRKLNLNYNRKIKTISDLSVFSDLTYVFMTNNSLKDTSMFENTTNIEILDLSCNEINDISSLKQNTKLITADFSENNISDISAISNCSSLTEINFSNNMITDVEPLSHCNQLLYCTGYNNYVEDISFFENHQNILVLDFTNNLISTIDDVLQNNNLRELYVDNNLLEHNETEIEAFLKSKDIANSKLYALIFKPYKKYICATDISSYNMSIKRTDRFVVPDVVVYPYNATYSNNLYFSSSNNLIKINEHSNTIQYNPEHDEMHNYSSEVFYSCDTLEGSFVVDVLMPTIADVSLEKYNFDEQYVDSYISIVTTTDTTKIKIEQSNSTEQITNEYTLLSDNVSYEDYGDERIIKIKLNEVPASNINILVYAGDTLGYFTTKSIDNNIVNISITSKEIVDIFGNAHILLINDSLIKKIGSNAFDSNCNFDTVVLSSNITNISNNSFNGANINNLYIKNRSCSIASNAFYGCNSTTIFVSNNLNVEVPDGVTLNDDFEIMGNYLRKYCGDAQEVIIPKYFGLTSIYAEAFYNNDYIQKIDLSKINSIGNYAFYDCNALCDIGGKISVSSLGSYVFYNSSIEDIYIDYTGYISSTSVLWESSFYDCDKLKTVAINCKGQINLGSNLFNDCYALESVNLDGKQVFVLENSCFENCPNLKSINFNKISLSGTRVFANCTGLSGEIVYNYDSIPEYSFYNCSQITSFSCRTPQETTIGNCAFGKTNGLLTLGLISHKITCDTNSFNEISSNLKIYINSNTDNNLELADNLLELGIDVCADYNISVGSNEVYLLEYSGDDTDICIPECLKIDKIGSYSFENNDEMLSVDIPNSVILINNNAFANNDLLNSINGCENVLFIESYAFAYCPNLETIPSFNSLLTMGEHAFDSTAIERIVLPNTLLALLNNAFANCANLQEVVLNGLYELISSGVFENCSNLKRCELTYDCTYINSTAFSGCLSLEHLYIPSSVKNIYSYYFPENIKIYCENNAQFIPSLTEEISNEIYPNYDILNGVLLDYQSETGYDYVDDNGKRVIEIPNTVRQVSDWVFFGNQNVDKVITSDYLYVIGEYAFMDCSVTEILMPPKMSHIGRSAFNRTGITSIDIPDGITKLEPFFMHCAPIQQVTIPESVTEICNDAFGDCQKLQSVYIPGNITSIDPSAFAGAAKPITLWGKDNSYLMQYANTNSQQNENNILICRLGFDITDNILNEYMGNDINVQVPTCMQLNSIEDAAFKNNATVETISIASGISSIGSECFSGCTSLSSLLIPDDVVYVGENAFYGIPNLTIYCNEGSYIEGYCIENNINANTDYDISDGVLNAYNGNATNLIIPSDWFITSIGSYAFDSNTNITSVTVPEGVREIRAFAFGRCSALTTVVLPASNNIKLSAGVFMDCINLTNIVNSTSITRVGNSAFGYCTSLESIDLSNVETISAYGFDFCSSLTNIILGASLTSMWQNAFANCENIIINCYSNTYAYQYAIDNDVPYILLDEVTTSTFSFSPSFNLNTTNSSSLDNIEERTIPSIEDKIDDYIQRECNGKVTRDNLDDIIAYIVDNGGDNHLI